MTNDGYPEQQHNNQALWNAIFAGTRLRHLDANDARVFVLTAILWGRQESKVIDVNTGEVFRFPWNELEFLDPVESNLPGFPEAAHKLDGGNG